MSTYLQYNNHMILHPTDSNKYIYGIAVDPPVPPTPSFDEVTIGSQTWMSKNLAIDDGQGGIYSQTVNYGQGDVVEYYYTWDAAVRIASNVQGWHLPTSSEWDTLASAVGSSTAGMKLKSTYGWKPDGGYDGNGTDDYAFTGLPAGYHYSSSFYSLGYDTYFWTATNHSPSSAYSRYFANTDNMIGSYRVSKTFGYSVRLVKD